VSTEPLLSARGVTKRYPGVLALDAVDFDLCAGEVHALMGENGAGKSTLIRVLTGATMPEGGEMMLAGARFEPRYPAEAQRRGVVAVYQELNLVPTLSGAENICLGRQPRRWFGLDRRAQLREATEAIRPLGVGLDLNRELGTLSAAEQQLIAIARALSMRPRVLVLDEPTSSLDARETERLFGIIRELKGRGLGIIFITHFLEQVYRVADRITVLRNGRRVATSVAGTLGRAELVRQMLGDTGVGTECAAPARIARPADPVLRVKGVGSPSTLAPVSFDLHPGEVLGFAGLLGSGRTEAAELIFGIRRPGSGSISVDGQRVRPESPRRSIARGLCLSPEDRRRDGLFPGMSVRDNISIVAQRRMGRAGLLSRRRHRRLAGELGARVGIAPGNAERGAGTLSGGNQQKVMLARWLAVEPRVLILDEPTRGVDVGSRAQIERTIGELAAGRAGISGMGVIFISAELEELTRRCSRVLVFRDREVVGELAGGELTYQRILGLIAQ
jgi:galactofuranose transport system ATP-binding protein